MFTRTPWTFTYKASADGFEVHSVDLNGAGDYACLTYSKDDARLIAAAPDLLEKGRALLLALYQEFPEKMPLSFRNEAEELREACDKAEGRS